MLLRSVLLVARRTASDIVSLLESVRSLDRILAGLTILGITIFAARRILARYICCGCVYVRPSVTSRSSTNVESQK